MIWMRFSRTLLPELVLISNDSRTPSLVRMPSLTTASIQAPLFVYYLYNLDPSRASYKLFSDKNVRKALHMALDRLGASDARLILRHLLPNSLHVLIVFASLALGSVILIEAGLDFLGLGIAPPTPSWGNMLTNSETFFFHSRWLVFWPGATIFLAVLAANLFGNAIRDAFDPRLR